tara:strand:- start:177 stop:731 length:555 start_codon:yes stop_codon:yes gene_type:complete
MIFSRCKSEIYYLLSSLLKSYDIEIIKNIYNKKKELEEKETLKWYIKEGNKYKKYKEGIIINHILFNPYHESVKSMHVYHKKIFHLKILIEIFSLKGFILIKHNNEYILPSLKTHIQILNYYVENYGILDIYNKIFQYYINLTDLVGNRCIRSIVLDNDEYIYKTIAIQDNKYIEPVDRLPRYI